MGGHRPLTCKKVIFIESCCSRERKKIFRPPVTLWQVSHLQPCLWRQQIIVQTSQIRQKIRAALMDFSFFFVP